MSQKIKNEVESVAQSVILPWNYKRVEPDNPLFPLPKDYETLTVDGQREARVAAIRSFDRSPLHFVAAWDLFRRLYLMTTEEGFFYHKFVPSPEFHYEMLYQVGMYGRNLFAAPRGFAKSIVIGTELPLMLMLAKPNIRLAICLATKPMIEQRFGILQKQLTENKNIIADFGVQRGKKGSKSWSKEFMETMLGARVTGLSVIGRKRGARPDMFILDDPEVDESPSSETRSVISREKFENVLFQQIIPMLEKGSTITWIGTLIGKSSFLSYAVSGEDPRFEYWNKKVYKAGDPTAAASERKKILWDGKWDAETLKIRKAEIGASAYSKEYMNEVDSEQDHVLEFDPKKNLFDIAKPDRVFEEEPTRSTSSVTYMELSPEAGWKWVKQTKELREMLASQYMALLVDSAHTISPHSDFSAVVAVGFDSLNTLWIWDAWMGRCTHKELLNQIFRVGFRWKVKVIGIEACGRQVELVEAAETLLEERRIVGWQPRVYPIRYPSQKPTAKADRIAGLEWRFPRGKIKFPGNWLDKWPWTEIMAEIQDFTYDLSMLAHDDGIDCIAMAHFVVHGRGSNAPPEAPRTTLADQIRMGNTQILPGVSRLSGMNADELTYELLDALIERAYNLGHHGKGQDTGGRRRPFYDHHKYRARVRGRRQHDGTKHDTLVSIGGAVARIDRRSFDPTPLLDQNGQPIDPRAL